MVAQLLGLRVRVLGNTFRRSPTQVLGMLIGLLFAVVACAVAIAGFSALRSLDLSIASGISVTAGSLIVLGFFLVPLAFGADDSLDPRSFALLGVPAGRLAPGLAVAALIGVPTVVIAIVALAGVAPWAGDPTAAGFAVIGAVLIVATSVLGARLTTSLAALFLSTRRAREVTGLVALIVVVCLAPLVVTLATADLTADGEGMLSRFAGIAGWTPFGAAWSAPAEAASGSTGLAVAKLVIAVVSLGLLWLAWRALVGWMLVSVRRERPVKQYRGLGWFGAMPDTPAGAVAARSITYWVRDSRYHTALVAIPVAPIIFVLALSVAGVPWHALALIPLPVMCLFLSWSIHNDVAFDSSAVWLHVASNTSGQADRFGRLVPALLIGIPLVIVGAPISASLFGDMSVLPSVFGVCVSLLLAGLGLSSIISARFPYPSVRPGDSPYAQPQASGTSSGLIQSFAFFSAIVVSIPALGLAALGILYGGAWPLASLAAGLIVGVGVFAIGIGWGGHVFRRRGPELLAFTLRN